MDNTLSIYIKIKHSYLYNKNKNIKKSIFFFHFESVKQKTVGKKQHLIQFFNKTAEIHHKKN